MNSTLDIGGQPAKSKQINVRITAAQERLLKQYCVRAGVNRNTVVLAALCAMIEGFENAGATSPTVVNPGKD